MSPGGTRKIFLAIAFLAFCFGASSVQAAPCTNTPADGPWFGFPNVHYSDNTVNVVIDCDWNGTSFYIHANSVTVTVNGSITTTGTDGIKLYAGLNDKNQKCASATDTNSTITINGPLTDLNSNGDIDLRACWDIAFNTVTVSSNHALISAQCFLPVTAFSPNPPPTGIPGSAYGCQVKAVDSTFPQAQHIYFTSQGDMTLLGDVFQTQSPLDNMRFISNFGNIYAGETLCTGGQQDIILHCGPDDPFWDPNLNSVVIPAADCNLCQGCQPKTSKFSGGIESNAFFFAEQFIDLSGACINIAENITITADARSPVSPYGVLTPPAGAPFLGFDINIQDAEIRNDFGKGGDIAILAQPNLKGGLPLAPGGVCFKPPTPPGQCEGFGPIGYQNAVLVSNGSNGGGIDPQAVSFMNGWGVIMAGNCGPVTLTCTPPFGGGAIFPFGWIADPGTAPHPPGPGGISPDGRSNHFVFGTPRCDS